MSRLRAGGALLAVVLSTSLVLAACGDDDSTSETVGDNATSMDMADGDHEDEHTFDWGAPGDPGDADRVIEITASDSFRFDPDLVGVEVGETVTFRVTNTGAITHEFVVGTPEEQTEHEAEMEDMGAMPMEDEPNAITVESGETKDLTLTFTEAGTLEFACHVTGHFAAGMVGDLSVRS